MITKCISKCTIQIVFGRLIDVTPTRKTKKFQIKIPRNLKLTVDCYYTTIYILLLILIVISILYTVFINYSRV